MLALYRGDPKRGGVLVGYFDTVPDAQCAIADDSKKHEVGTIYYMEDDDEKRGCEEGPEVLPGQHE